MGVWWGYMLFRDFIRFRYSKIVLGGWLKEKKGNLI